MMAPRRTTPGGPVDWQEIRRRVEAAGRAVAGETAASPERVREILEDRARALARPAALPSSGAAIEAITFTLANETYAVESRHVFEVFRLEDLSPLPGAKPPVFAVTAWRGDLLTILDLRTVLGLAVTTLNDLSRVIVLGAERPAFGILADTVQQLMTIATAAVQLVPEDRGRKWDFLRGMTPGAVLVLDGERLLQLVKPDPT